MKKLICLTFLLISILAPSSGVTLGFNEGNMAFPLNLEGLDDIRSGRYTLIKFWQSTCPPCREEIEGFKDFYSRSSEEMNIIFIAVNKDEGVLNTYLRETGLDKDIPVYFDRGRKNTRTYGLRRTPTTFLLDERGVIVSRWTGATKWDEVDAADLIEVK
ncbi:thioredoxin [Propionigenium maris DSM 9537]|uniref:Thioredoxin n=1 Tax=Propionigenium maris DSM 9537 TaxID=1123000 RepID=A0A9W6GIS7_9FUSO|nr:TlpA disulfide reductase family protein [Propionigenium maris]GLI54531.1 thioredoxin [Propionigenium maris DSM 9537]